MKLASGFAALLIATSVIGGGVYAWSKAYSGSFEQTQIVKAAKPLKVEEIDKIASEITVLIDATLSGSGVLIAKERGWAGATYYVLTAKHVIQGKNEFDVVTPDGERYRLTQKDVFDYLPDADLAVVQFRSKQQYSIAKVTNWEFQNRSIYFDKQEYEDMPWVFVSGFPDPTQESDFQNQKRLFTTGIFRNSTDSPFSGSDASLSDGYELTYTSATYRGMSGSPILDVSGRLIGIHGRNTGQVVTGNRRIILGDSIGVPISKFIKSKSEKLKNLIALLSIDESQPLKTVDDPARYLEAILQPEYQLFEKDCRTDSCLNYINLLTRFDNDNTAFKLIEIYLNSGDNKAFYPAWFIRAKILAALGKYEESLSSLEESIRLNPDFYEARVLQCSLLWSSLKKYEEAVTACNKGIEIVEKLEKSGNLQIKPFNVWHQKAQALENMKRYKEAIESYTIAISILPNPHSYLNRGVNRVNGLNDSKGAIEDFTQAIQLNPNYTQAYVNRAVNRYAIADKEGASQDIDIAAKINMEYTVKQIVKTNPILLLFNSDKSNDRITFFQKKAIEIYSNSINQNPNSPNLYDWHKNRCILQSEFDIKNAIEDCNKSLELNPSSVDIYNVRASLYKALSDYPKALSDYSKHIELLPKSQTYSLMLSHSGKCEVFFRMKQYEPALQECQLAIKVHPDTPSIKESNGIIEFSKAMLTKADLYHLKSNVYSELGDNKMALQSVSSAIDLNEFNGYFYIDRALYILRSMQFYRDTDTKIISLGVDNVDKSIKMIEDLEKASQWLKNDENGRKILKQNIDGHIRFFSSIQQDEKVQSILAKLKKIE
jgi:tetratricopeptide (TPR) repeat protein